MSLAENFTIFESLIKGNNSNYFSGDSVGSFFQNVSIKSLEFQDESQDENKIRGDKFILCLNCDAKVPVSDLKISLRDNGAGSIIFCENCEIPESNDENFNFYKFFIEMRKHYGYFLNYDNIIQKYEDDINNLIDMSFEILKNKFKERLKSELNMNRTSRDEIKCIESIEGLNEISAENIKIIKDIIDKNKITIEIMRESYTKSLEANEGKLKDIRLSFEKFEKYFSNYTKREITAFNFVIFPPVTQRINMTTNYSSENNILCLSKKSNPYIKSVVTGPIKPTHQKTKSSNIFHDQFQRRVSECGDNKCLKKVINGSGGLEVIKENAEINTTVVN